MKITITSLKPRNPLVAPALLRRAGSHQAGARMQRRHAVRALRRELLQLKDGP